MSRTNLNDLASDIATAEGLEQSVGVAQVKEILGILGERWRGMHDVDVIAEVRCITARAGTDSAHRE